MTCSAAFIAGLVIGGIVTFFVRDRLMRDKSGDAKPKSGGGPGEGGEGP